MKNLILTFALAIFTSLTFGQNAINYQGVCSTTSGVVANQTISVSVDIHDVTSTGPVVFSETHTVTTNDNGLFSIEIGNGTVSLGQINTVDFSTPTFMELGIDTLGGSSFVTMGTSQFLSVPNAFYASQAATSDTASYASEAGTVATPELDAGSYTANLVSTTLTVSLNTTTENTLLPSDLANIDIFFFDAGDNIIGSTSTSYGYPTPNAISIDSSMFSGTSYIVFIFESFNGRFTVTYNI